MDNYKPYFKYLKSLSLRVALIFLLIMVLNIFPSIQTSLQMDLMENGTIGYTSQHLASGWIFIFMIGVFYSVALFSQAMSIRADRVGYLKAAILWGVIMSIGMSIFGYSVDVIIKFILEAKTGHEVCIYSPMMWIDIDNLKASTNLVNRIFSNLMIFSIAFMIGSVWYRLKTKYNILLFGVVPFCSLISLTNYVMRNPEKMNELGLKVVNMMAYFMQNQGVAIVAKGIAITIYMLIAIKLLIKAPIKDYANDLI